LNETKKPEIHYDISGFQIDILMYDSCFLIIPQWLWIYSPINKIH